MPTITSAKSSTSAGNLRAKGSRARPASRHGSIAGATLLNPAQATSLPAVRFSSCVDGEVRMATASSLNREEANRYNRRHSNRLINTTTLAMISVDASNTSNRPESLARLMVLPSPGAETIFP